MNRKVPILFILISLSVAVFSQKMQFTHQDSLWVDYTLAQLSLDKKIGQLFMIDVSPIEESSSQKKAVVSAIKKYGVGGAIVMKGDYNTTRDWVSYFQEISKIPLMIAIDGEWGINMRIKSATKFPYQLTLGAIVEDDLIYEMGQNIARQCKELGIHINFAPVIDVNTNPKNPVINYRSFGENKYNVAAKGLSYALGMQSQGVMACLKHFPGHGDTDKDSHKDLPLVNKSKEELENVELYPFRELIKESVWSVMVGHLNVPALDASGKPSSLSYATTTELLRHDMGFQGLVFSDALNMRGASMSSAAGQLELDAYIAGNDILLYSVNIGLAIDKIKEHVLQNKENRVEFEERLYRIMLYKHRLVYPINEFQNNKSSDDALSQLLYDKSITYISKTPYSYNKLMTDSKKTLWISVGDKYNTLNQAVNVKDNVSTIYVDNNESMLSLEKITETSKNYDQVIIAYHDLSQYASKNYGLSNNIINFIKDVNYSEKVYNIWFGNPYGLQYFQDAYNIIVAYEDNTLTHKSVLSVLEKRSSPAGRLPVSVGIYLEGENDVATEVRIVKSEPVVDFVENKSRLIAQVDDICQDMIVQGATPGCQIAVYHKGKELIKKSYGYYTYAYDAPSVNNENLYDLASLTKIMSTTLAVMKLKEMGKINLYNTVGEYLILDDSNTISDIFINQLLTHEAGLTPFIPFYARFVDSNYYQYFSPQYSSYFTTQVADNLYIKSDYKDTMWHEMCHANRSPTGSYVYSDLSMYILQKVVEAAAGEPLDEFVYKHFYNKMNVGLKYNPTQYYPKSMIIPTENDFSFRKQLVQGYVHDQGCALYGGVCGHAGVFGNAADVAKIMQMLLNGGVWNGKKLLDELTIKQFARYQGTSSRRGFGFDKPEFKDRDRGPTSSDCSLETFGHTGFTGTCAWADPRDELVFVFLSNRIHPSADNKKLIYGDYRTRLQSLFHQYAK